MVVQGNLAVKIVTGCVRLAAAQMAGPEAEVPVVPTVGRAEGRDMKLPMETVVQEGLGLLEAREAREVLHRIPVALFRIHALVCILIRAFVVRPVLMAVMEVQDRTGMVASHLVR